MILHGVKEHVLLKERMVLPRGFNVIFYLHNDYQITLKTRKTLFPNLKVPYLGSYVSLTQWFRSELASNEDQT